MARTPDDKKDESRSNSAAHRKMQQECAAGLRDIADQRKALNQEAGEIRERLRDAGVEPKAFALVMKMADLEDKSAVNQYMSTLRDGWEALEVGGQLDFVSVEIEQDNAEQDAVSAPEEQ